MGRLSGFVTAALLFVLAWGVFSGVALAEDNSLQRVLDAGKLVIGIDDAYPPMEFRDENNQLVGFDIDLAREIGKRLGVEVEWVPTEWSGVILALKAKKFDIILSAMSITEERAKQVDFSPPYLMESQVVVVSDKSKGINTAEDLVGKVVGTQLGSTSEEAARKVEGIKEIKTYNKFTEVFMDLGIGRIDAGVVDELVGRYYMTQRPGMFKVVDYLVDEPVGIAFRQEDDALREKINEIVAEIKADGTLAEISKKWFGEDITSR